MNCIKWYKGFAIGISKIVVAIITMTAVLMFTSCSAPAYTAPAYGNTPMNIQNMGLAAENEGWIYYSNSGDAWALYKIRLDGTEKTKLNKERSSCINVAGGWVYYSSIGSKSGSICRVRTDGTDGEILNKDMRAPQVLVYEDWIYYTGWSQEDVYLYRMKTDGTEETCFDIKTTAFNINDGWIYFTDRSDSKYYKMRLDGSEKTGVDADYSKAAFIDGWIYYCDEGRPAKMRADGTERKILTEDTVRYFNVAEGWIYYTSGSDGESINKMRTDGTEVTKLNAGSAYFLINIAGDWIYYNIAGEYYRMKTDGSENQKVE